MKTLGINPGVFLGCGNVWIAQGALLLRQMGFSQ
jgi:hypothetical protein